MEDAVLMLTAPTFLEVSRAPVRKDTLETDSPAPVNRGKANCLHVSRSRGY